KLPEGRLAAADLGEVPRRMARRAAAILYQSSRLGDGQGRGRVRACLTGQALACLSFAMDLDQVISELQQGALAQLNGAATLDAVEAVRVEALGRKGKLNEISKKFGTLAPE